jgi:hypothetical protein
LVSSTITNSTAFLPSCFVLGVALAPLLDAEVEVVGVLLLKIALFLCHASFRRGWRRPAGRVLDHVLVDGLDQRVVGDGLDEDRAVVVLGRGGDVDLQRQAPSFCNMRWWMSWMDLNHAMRVRRGCGGPRR